MHFDAPGTQPFVSFVVSMDTFSAPTIQTPGPMLGVEAVTIAAAPVASVFSGDDSGGAGGGSLVLSELPFTHDVNFDDTPVYTASTDTPWIFVSDFSGDGWFFV